MKVNELINSQNFIFNVSFRVVEYTPIDGDPDHVTVLYQSDDPSDCPADIGDRFISAINQDEDMGVIDIESIE